MMSFAHEKSSGEGGGGGGGGKSVSVTGLHPARPKKVKSVPLGERRC